MVLVVATRVMNRRLAGDLAPAAGMAVAAVAGTYSELRAAAHVPLSPVYGLVLAAVAGVLLCWRRRFPLTVVSGVVAVSFAYHLLGYPGLAPAVTLFVAAYTATAAPDRGRLPLVIGLIVLVAVIPVLPPYPAGFNAGALFGPPVAMIGVAALGEATRLRRMSTEERLHAARTAAAEETRRHQVEERLKIARELHDVLAHTVTVISVQAAVGAEALEDRPQDARRALAAVRTAAREAMSELRSTLAVLRDTASTTPPQPGLTDLPRLLDQARSAGLTVNVTTTGTSQPVPPAVELAVYRIVQEALTNTIRHSTAGAARVSLAYTTHEVTVEIHDDGPPTAAAGSAPGSGLGSEPAAGSHGLVGMRERVRALGGTLDAGPVPVGGFRVAARLPVGGAA